MNKAIENTNLRMLYHIVPMLLTLYAILFLFAHYLQKADKKLTLFSPSRIRWAVMFALLLLGLNNLFRLNIYVGMDSTLHYLYLEYVADHWSIPLASEGLFAFRSPLFYMIAALPYALFKLLLGNDLAACAIRIVPILMGIIQVEILYRIGKQLYPKHPRAIMWLTCIGAFLPINLYMSQVISDEIVAGMTGGMVILMGVYLLRNDRVPSWRESMLAGALLGLAFLSKMTTLLLMPPCIVIMLVCHRGGEDASVRRLYQNLALATVTCFVVSGWFYVRNRVELGSFAPKSWDNDVFVWWQYPGFRTAEHYLQFGDALTQPLYSGMSSFWDGLYSTLWLDGWSSGMLSISPGWNNPLLIAAAWLGLLPTFLIFTGVIVPFVRLLREKNKRCDLQVRVYFFSTGCILLYLLAILNLHLTVPVYSQVKASYMLSILPCIALTALRGFQIIEQRCNPAMLSALYAGISCWAFVSYVGYFEAF